MRAFLLGTMPGILVRNARKSKKNCFGNGCPRRTENAFLYNHVEDSRRDGRVAEGGGLLNRYRVKSSIEGSNPSLSASFFPVLLPIQLVKLQSTAPLFVVIGL